MNIRFEYVYRDAGNFKNWGEIIFANGDDHDPALIEGKARDVLIDREFFIAKKAKVPDLHFEDYRPSLDHDWHALLTFTYTKDCADDPAKRDISEFLEDLKQARTQTI